VKFLALLLLQLGLISIAYVSKAGAETSVPGTCDTTIALKIIDSNSCAVFGPATNSGDTTYQFILVTNYAVSGCVAGGSSSSTNTHHVRITDVDITHTQGNDGALAELETALDLTDLVTFSATTTAGTNLMSSSSAQLGDGTTACNGMSAGKIDAPIYQMRDAKATAGAQTNQAFASNWVDEHHNGEKYAMKCHLGGTTTDACLYSSALSGSESVTFNTITKSGLQRFPASQLAIVSEGIDPSKLPGDTLTATVTLVSSYSAAGVNTTDATFAYGDVTPTLAY